MSQDVNYKSFVEQNGLIIDYWENPTYPSQFSDVMKFSNCKNVIVNGVTIDGGTEDCIDAVRGENYLFQNLSLNLYRNGITIKGSIDGWHLKNILFNRKGADYTVEIGQYDNYWHVKRPPTRNGIIENIRLENGSTLTIRVWDAEKPTLLNCPNVRVIKIPKLIWFPYFVFRSVQREGLGFFKKSIDILRGKE